MENRQGKTSFETPMTKVKLKIKYKPKKEKERKVMKVQIQYFTTKSEAMLDLELSKGEQNKLREIIEGAIEKFPHKDKKKDKGGVGTNKIMLEKMIPSIPERDK